MVESWGLKNEEPTQKPKSVDFDDWVDDYGLSERDVSFLLGRPLAKLNIPKPIQMVWKDEIAGGGPVWEMEGKPSPGPRSADGIRRKWAYKVSDPPLFHKELVTAIQQCGVDNLEVFPVAINDPRTGEVCNDYLAVNFVGLLKAADMSKSQATSHSPDGLIDTDFDSVAINERVVRDFKMFRLAECVTALVVHRSIKEHLESLGGFELTFTEPKDWIG
jgi:hypothetical protein